MSTEPSKAAVLSAIENLPYAKFLGVHFRLENDEIIAYLPFQETHIGNPVARALHGGVSSAFLELTAVAEIVCETRARYDFEQAVPRPKPITITVDYLRLGKPQEAFASARVKRAGRRFASVDVEAWQDNRARPFVSATCHFRMPDSKD